MKEVKKLQDYKEIYYYGLNESHSYNDKIKNHLTILSILGAGIVFMTNKIVELEFIFSPIPIIFAILFWSSIIFFLIAFFFVYVAYYDYDYKYVIPVTYKDIEDDISALIKERVEFDVELYRHQSILNAYEIAATCNIKENDKKVFRHERLNIILYINTAFLIITYAMWVMIINRITF